MSLAASEERALAQIEAALRRSDPKLAAMLSTFNRLNQSEEMPRREFLLRPTRLGWFASSPRPAHLPPDRTLTSLSRRPSRIGRVLPVIMATCVLGLMVAIFTVIGHGKPTTMIQTRGSQCVPTVVNSCQVSTGSAGPSAKGRAG